MTSLPFASLIRTDRVRKDYGNVAELAQSLYEKGFIHPLCINHTQELIAGGRRSAALDHLLSDPASFPAPQAHSSMQDFLASGNLQFGVHFTTRATETIDELSELELIENIQRKSFSWQEEVLATAKVHALKTQAFHLGQIADVDDWGQKATGRLLGISQSNVSYSLRLAEHLRSSDSPMWKLASIIEALSYLTKLRHDEASEALARSVQQRAATLPTIVSNGTPVDITAFITQFDPTVFQSGASVGLDLSEFGPAPTPSTTPPPGSVVIIAEDKRAEIEAVVTKIVHNLDCLEFFRQLGPNSVDHIVTDPPYGIDMRMLKQAGGGGQQDIDRVAETHGVEDNLAAFEPWLEGCYTVLKDRGFCIWFCDAMHFRHLHDMGLKIGFKVCRWPFHWIKTSPCINQRAEYNFTKSVEHAVLFRKGDARLVTAQSTNVFMGGLTSEDKLALPNHPFIKPMALWQHLLRAVALPGSLVCDPFSGVGSMPRAAILGGWSPITCELDPVHYSQQIHNLAQAYLSLKPNTGGLQEEVMY